MVQSAKTSGLRMLIPALDAAKGFGELKAVLKEIISLVEKSHIQVREDLVNLECGTEIEFGTGGTVKGEDGNWRLSNDGTNLLVQRKESGIWTPTKYTFEAS